MRFPAIALGLGLAISQAEAADLSFQVANRGAIAVTGLAAVPKGAELAEPVPIANSVIAPGRTVFIAFAVPEGLCLFDLTINVADGDDTLRPDIDLCQLEVLVIE